MECHKGFDYCFLGEDSLILFQTAFATNTYKHQLTRINVTCPILNRTFPVAEWLSFQTKLKKMELAVLMVQRLDDWLCPVNKDELGRDF